LSETKKNVDQHLLSSYRQQLKLKVYNDRKVFEVIKGSIEVRPKCPICGKQFNEYNEPSMHEVLVTRGDVQSLPLDKQLRIFDPCNVVLVHEGDCHIFAQHTDEGKAKCFSQIVHFTNIHAVMTFVIEIEELITNKLYRARKMINEYNDQLHFI